MRLTIGEAMAILRKRMGLEKARELVLTARSCGIATARGTILKKDMSFDNPYVTWDVIKELAKAGKASKFFEIGDTKRLGGVPFRIQCIVHEDAGDKIALQPLKPIGDLAKAGSITDGNKWHTWEEAEKIASRLYYHLNVILDEDIFTSSNQIAVGDNDKTYACAEGIGDVRYEISTSDRVAVATSIGTNYWSSTAYYFGNHYIVGSGGDVYYNNDPYTYGCAPVVWIE